MTKQNINIGDGERLASAGLGVFLTWRSLRRGGVGSLLTAAGGLALIYRGVTGRSPLYAGLGTSTAKSTGIAAPSAPPIKVTMAFHTPERLLLTQARRYIGTLLAADENVQKVRTWAKSGNDSPGFRWECGRQRGRVLSAPIVGADGCLLTIEVAAPQLGARLPRALAKRSLTESLRRFKMLIEAGEVATTGGQPHGQRGPLGEAVQGLVAHLGRQNGGLWPTAVDQPMTVKLSEERSAHEPTAENIATPTDNAETVGGLL